MVGMPVSLPFTAADIRLAAGDRSYGRGLEYVNAVDHLEISDTEVTANVYGSSEYTVCLVIDDQRLSGGCTCPYGRDGFFCKHCVAVGLSVLELGGRTSTPSRGRARPAAGSRCLVAVALEGGTAGRIARAPGREPGVASALRATGRGDEHRRAGDPARRDGLHHAAPRRVSRPTTRFTATPTRYTTRS